MSEEKTYAIRLGGIPIDVPNGNGRVYTREVVEKMAEQMKDLAKAGKLHVYVENGLPRPPSMSDIQGRPVDVRFDGERIDVDILPFKGTHLKAFLEAEVPISIAPSGQATLKKDEDGNFVVQDDYKVGYLGVSPQSSTEQDLGRGTDEESEL